VDWVIRTADLDYGLGSMTKIVDVGVYSERMAAAGKTVLQGMFVEVLASGIGASYQEDRDWKVSKVM